MNMDERKLTYDQFKADILHWKNTHREEYNRFARLMTNGDKRQYCYGRNSAYTVLPAVKVTRPGIMTEGMTHHFLRHAFH